VGAQGGLRKRETGMDEKREEKRRRFGEGCGDAVEALCSK